MGAAGGSAADLTAPSDGLVVVAIDAMTPAGRGPRPPQELRAGDVAVRVAPREYYAVQLNR